MIKYQELNIDKAGLQQIMSYALDPGLLKKAADIDTFADMRFDVVETDQ